ncbi:hypothetical protein [Streptomyces sp. HUAS TT7]|uniref:hypothetical protein n=1 Tax=Streptomyces sp. HUAS TT7 TaxID=3447507 RepID=UPI003F65591B
MPGHCHPGWQEKAEKEAGERAFAPAALLVLVVAALVVVAFWGLVMWVSHAVADMIGA